MTHITNDQPFEPRVDAAQRLIVQQAAASHPLSFPDPRIAMLLRDAESEPGELPLAAESDGS